MEKLINNLKTQGVKERTTTFSYKGKYDKEKDDANQYVENDVVCFEELNTKVFKKYNGSNWNTSPEININEEMLNKEFTSNDSVYYELINDGLKTSLAVTTPLVDFLNDYYNDYTHINIIDEDISDNNMQNYLRQSLANFINYNVFNLKKDDSNKIIKNIDVITNKYTSNQTDDNITLKITYLIFNKDGSEENEETIIVELDKTILNLDSSNQINQSNIKSSIPNDYGDDRSGWGQSVCIPKISIDKFGHVTDVNKNFYLRTPKRPYFYTTEVDVNVTGSDNWKNLDDSTWIDRFSSIGYNFNIYAGTPNAILEFVFINDDSYKQLPVRQEAKISLSSLLFKTNQAAQTDWVYINTFLRYKYYYYYESYVDGYGNRYDREAYSLKISFKYTKDYTYDVADNHIKTLYKVRMKVLTY